jgi:hypothetical protein
MTAWTEVKWTPDMEGVPVPDIPAEVVARCVGLGEAVEMVHDEDKCAVFYRVVNPYMTAEEHRLAEQDAERSDLTPLIRKANDEQAKRRQDNLRAWAEETG